MTANKVGAGNRQMTYKGNGAGRPAGTKNRYGKNSVKRMEELGLDPMEELVGLYNDCRDKYSTAVLNANDTKYWVREMRQILLTLMPYAYQTVRDEVDEESTADPLVIKAILVEPQKHDKMSTDE